MGPAAEGISKGDPTGRGPLRTEYIGAMERGTWE
jgi:hypothetical protein